MGSPNRFVEGREAPLLFWAWPSLLSIGFDRVALKTIYSSSIDSRSCSIDSSTSSNSSSSAGDRARRGEGGKGGFAKEEGLQRSH